MYEIELTPEEIEAALLEGRKKKYFHERSKEYWEAQELNSSRLKPGEHPQQVKQPESKSDANKPK